MKECESTQILLQGKAQPRDKYTQSGLRRNLWRCTEQWVSFYTYRLQKMLSLQGLLLSTSKDVAEKTQQARENKHLHRDVTRATSSYRKKAWKGPKGLSACPEARSTMPFLTAVSLTCFLKKLISTQMRRKEIFTSSERDLRRKNSLTNCLVALSATLQPLWAHSQGFTVHTHLGNCLIL